MAISKNTLYFAKIAYWILMSIGVLAITFVLFTFDGKPHALAGILWLIFGFMLVYIMYPYYFPPGTGTGQWPPFVSTCPDYLTYMGSNACMDFVGLGSPLLKKADRTNPPTPASSDYARYVFNNSGSLAEKTARAQQYGLSWQGVA